MNISIKEFVRSLLCAFRRGERATNQRFYFGFGVEVGSKQKVNMPLKIKISDEQKVTVTIVPATVKGKPVKLDGIPNWSVVDGNSAMTVADDGLSAVLVSEDTPGVTNILVAGDANLGEGVETITDTIELTVVDPQASTLGLTVGKPEDK